MNLTLVLMTFTPLATAVAIALIPGRASAAAARAIALAGAIVTLILSFAFLGGMIRDPGDWTAGVVFDWIRGWNIKFALGLDGLSGSMVLLTNVLSILAVLASWSAVKERAREFYAYLMLLQTGILGAFLALDLILFYVFWELMLVPLYFLIGIFGSERRIYATMKFFLYTMAGSVLMLVGIIALHFLAEPVGAERSFLIADLVQTSRQLPWNVKSWLFFAFFIAFAIKAPLFPFHTWLPDAHTEAPTAGSIVLAGVLLKTGVYGMMRIAIPLFPNVAHAYAPLVLTLSVVAIIYGALTAIAQTDMKRLVAYSSVSHMGFIVLGVFSFRPEAVSGAALQMINHGISTGALFFCVGVLYERRHTRMLADFGGLAHNMKLYATLTVIVALSSVGLPGLNGFVGEYLILLGTFQVRPWFASVAAVGVILAAVYLLKMVQQTFYGPLDKKENERLSDLNLREAFSLGLLVVLSFWIGLFPRPFTRMLEPAAHYISGLVSPAQMVDFKELESSGRGAFDP